MELNFNLFSFDATVIVMQTAGFDLRLIQSPTAILRFQRCFQSFCLLDGPVSSSTDFTLHGCQVRKIFKEKKRFFKVGEIYDSQRGKGKVDFFLSCQILR